MATSNETPAILENDNTNNTESNLKEKTENNKENMSEMKMEEQQITPAINSNNGAVSNLTDAMDSAKISEIMNSQGCYIFLIFCFFFFSLSQLKL